MDNIFTEVPTTFVIPVLDGSDPGYNWTVSGPSHAVVKTRGSRVVIVFNENATYVVGVTVWNDVNVELLTVWNDVILELLTVWNDVSSVSVDVEVKSRSVACFPPSVRIVGSARRSELRSRTVRLETVVSADCVDYRLKHDWSVWNGHCADVVANDSASLSDPILTDTPTLFLAARTLDYGTYCVKFRSCCTRLLLLNKCNG